MMRETNLHIYLNYKRSMFFLDSLQQTSSRAKKHLHPRAARVIFTLYIYQHLVIRKTNLFRHWLEPSTHDTHAPRRAGVHALLSQFRGERGWTIHFFDIIGTYIYLPRGKRTTTRASFTSLSPPSGLIGERDSCARVSKYIDASLYVRLCRKNFRCRGMLRDVYCFVVILDYIVQDSV